VQGAVRGVVPGPAPAVPVAGAAPRTPVGRPPPPRGPPRTVRPPRGGPKVTNRRAIFDLAANSDASLRVLGCASRPAPGPPPRYRWRRRLPGPSPGGDGSRRAPSRARSPVVCRGTHAFFIHDFMCFFRRKGYSLGASVGGPGSGVEKSEFSVSPISVALGDELISEVRSCRTRTC